MKQKVFVIFMLISLISLFLIGCGQNEKEPVDNAKVPGKSNKERREDLIIAPPEEVQGKSEEEERQERIAAIKKNGIPSEVIKALDKYNDPNWDGDVFWSHYFVVLEATFGGPVPYKVVGKTEFSYNDALTLTGDRAKESKAARREVYLALTYFVGLNRAFGVFVDKLADTSELIENNKDKLRLQALLIKILVDIRKSAKAYYIDSYDTLRNKLDNLESLSGSDVKSLSIKLGKLETAQSTLMSDVVEPFKKKYPDLATFLNDLAVASDSGDVTADGLLKYWDTLSAKFDSSCNEIIRLGGEIKGILDNIKVKS
ncbi:virulence associated lipoprotein [Borrelia duttonii]|uniref:virulence associated lipoprotein n=1 Tax=Borrelia duttonii TaxID=40834 RepID=UPI0004AE2181|nr:virulence associated lipoprotein [Borrelia duttonii]